MHYGKCRTQCFWNLLAHTRHLKSGYLSLCCITFDHSCFNLSLTRHPASLKCKTKSPEWPFKHPDLVIALNSAPTSDISEMAAKEKPLLMQKATRFTFILNYSLNLCLCICCQNCLADDFKICIRESGVSLNALLWRNNKIVSISVALPSNNYVNVTEICTLYKLWWIPSYKSMQIYFQILLNLIETNPFVNLCYTSVWVVTL